MPVSKAEIEKRPVGDIPEVQGNVRVRVTRRGHGQISTGRHLEVTGEELFAKDEEFSVSKDIADVLEEKGYVNILEDEEPAKRGPGRPPKAVSDE